MADKNDLEQISTTDSKTLPEQLCNSYEDAHDEASSNIQSETRTFDIQSSLNRDSQALYQDAQASCDELHKYQVLLKTKDAIRDNLTALIHLDNEDSWYEIYKPPSNKTTSIIDASASYVNDDNMIKPSIHPEYQDQTSEDQTYEVYNKPIQMIEQDQTKEQAYEVYNKPIQMNIYEGLANDFSNSEKGKSHETSYIGMKLKQMASLEEGEEYDCINEYEHIGEDHVKHKYKEESSDTPTTPKGSLPINSFDIYEQLNTNATTFKFSDNISRRKCILVIKITLSLILLVFALLAVVVITNVVKNREYAASRGEEPAESNNRSTGERERGLDARLFLNNPHLFGVIHGIGKYIHGITVLNNQVFVAHLSPQVNVYDTNTLTLTRKITITGAARPSAIVASLRYNCLYISDIDLNVIYRYNLSDNVISNWSVGAQCFGLSLTGTHNILVTLRQNKTINEYTPDGSLVREISLDSSIEHPRHGVQLSSDQFVVSHGDFRSLTLNRICIVNTSGSIIQSYGDFRGTGNDRFDTPLTIAVDSRGNLIIADRANNRTMILSPSLAYVGQIARSEYKLDRVFGLHLDLLTRRLYIGEDAEAGRVLVLTV